MSIHTHNDVSFKIFLTAVSPYTSKDLSDHVKTVKVTDGINEHDNTAMGSIYETTTDGLRRASFEVTFFDDFDANSVHSVLQPLIGSATAFNVEVIPVESDAVSATNPRITITNARISGDYTPLDATAGGDVPMTSVVFRPKHGGTLVYSST